MLKNQRMNKVNNKGLSLVELLVAVAILASISITIALFMGSSSRTYTKENADATIQAEAQVVANAISDRIIDCDSHINYGPSVSINGLPSTTYTDSDGNTLQRFGDDAGNVLEICNRKMKETIILDRQNEIVYYLQVTRENTESAFPNYTYGNDERLDTSGNRDILAENVIDFKVNTNRYDKDHIIYFDLTYKKDNKQYKGTYQVNVRNHITIDDVDKLEPEEGDRVSSIYVSPQESFINITSDGVCEQPFSSNKLNEIIYTVTYKPFTARNFAPEWSIEANEDTGCTITQDKDADGKVIDKKVAKLNVTQDRSKYTQKFFKIKVKQQNSESDIIETAATVYVRKVTGVAVYPIEGVKTDEDEGTYAVPGARVSFSAEVEGWNLNEASFKKIEWDVFCNDSSCCTPQKKKNHETCSKVKNVSAINDRIVVNFGTDNILNKQFSIVATSQFDTNAYGEYVLPIKNLGATYRPIIRGSYINLNDYVALFGDENGTIMYNLTGISVESINSDFGFSPTNASDFARMVKPDFTFYIDHNPVNLEFADDKVLGFYGPFKVKFVITGGDYSTPNLRIEFPAVSLHKTNKRLNSGMQTWSTISKSGRDNYTEVWNLLTDQEKNSVKKYYLDAKPEDLAKVQDATNRIVNYIEAQDASKYSDSKKTDLTACARKLTKQIPEDELVKIMGEIDSADNTIIIRKGYSKSLQFYARGYNIIDKSKFGIYLNPTKTDYGTNLNAGGKNAFMDAAITSSVGTLTSAVDNAVVTVQAFNSKNEPTYPKDGFDMNVCIDHFYHLYTAKEIAEKSTTKKLPVTNSFVSYKVYIANVEGHELFIPTPVSTEFKEITINKGSSKKITNFGPNKVTVTIARDNDDKYTMDYNGTTYVYNKTYCYWKEQ